MKCYNRELLIDFGMYAFVPVFTLFFWRGTWLLCDHYFYRDNLTASAWCSLVVGYVGSALFFAWQYCWHYSKYKKLVDINMCSVSCTKDVTAIVFLLLTRLETYIVGFFTVNSWRGIWLLQDVYLLAARPLLSAWVSHTIGTVCLILLCRFKSVYAPPVVSLTDNDFSATHLALLSRDCDSFISTESKKTVHEGEANQEDIEASGSINNNREIEIVSGSGNFL
jgi:hypothetical protein